MIDGFLTLFDKIHESYGLLVFVLFIYSVAVSTAFGWLLKKYVEGSDKQTEAVLLTTQTLSKNNLLFKEMKVSLSDEFNKTQTLLEVIKGVLMIRSGGGDGKNV